MGTNYNKAQVITVINLALQCASASPTARPTMSSVVSVLEGKAAFQDLMLEQSASHDDIKTKTEAPSKHVQHDLEHKTGESEIQIMSIDNRWTDSSTSAQDLYPVTLDSSYWENRN